MDEKQIIDRIGKTLVNKAKILNSCRDPRFLNDVRSELIGIEQLLSDIRIKYSWQYDKERIVGVTVQDKKFRV